MNSTRYIGTISWIGFRYWHWQVSNPWDLGTYQFAWNGKGRVYISSSGNFLTDIRADNILTIIGPKGEKTVEGTQAALDITDILDENASLQTLHLILKDTDGGFIATSPLYIVQKTLDKEDPDEPPLFPIPIPIYPPLSWNDTIINHPDVLPTGYPDLRPDPEKNGMQWNDWPIAKGGFKVVIGYYMTVFGAPFPGVWLVTSGLIEITIHCFTEPSYR
ncbi:hypothetical protein BK007_01830 [Methanobacterium subterraneum]|uniref:Uncharacterized protein n=1 Tax=Methanobacterium subterraneum TaxID=59277 RepID=A0A2H4V9W6_9EURY|nr:hypothetical protein BK007_01830 [Methanobacterium subterraneum]